MMIEEKAVVISSNAQYAWVSPMKSGSCSGCPSESTCSTSFLNSILKRKSQRTIRIENLDNATTGEHVIVGIHSVNLLLSSVLAYLLPILCLLLFALIGKVFFNETVSIVLGLAGLAFGFLAANRAAANVTVCGKLEPVMLGKTKDEQKVVEFNPATKLLRL
jgi:sigma-E factor negative regulatory protein RseC